MTKPTKAQIEAAENTDRELWREREGDYYADSIHVTKEGGIGMNCGGHVIVMPIREWFALTALEVVDTEIDRLHGIIKDMDGAIDKLEHEKSATKPTQLELERLNEIMERNETIERCAQVADAYSYGEGIAAEIRRLKDER